MLRRLSRLWRSGGPESGTNSTADPHSECANPGPSSAPQPIATSGDQPARSSSILPSTQPVLTLTGAPAPDYRGFHEGATGQRISGWAWDSARPDEPIDVDIYDGDTLLATVRANRFHQSLLDARRGNGQHLFFYALPTRLKDGQPHIIRIKVAGTSIELNKTPKTITCEIE